ncbi:MAG: Holliday junction resolvase RuvX [Armatimonadota bacterium]|nr:Holliday junction resolvase RuvX [Armatimonadota bacterium]
MGRVLAVDPGERRLGLALSDPTGTIALPYEVRTRAGWASDLAYLREIIARHDVDTIVVGRPLTMRGTEGAQAREASRFAARLRAAVSVPVHEVDERFSTAAADRVLREGGRRPSARRAYRDAVAASLILQPFLDRRSVTGPLRGSNGGVMLAP